MRQVLQNLKDGTTSLADVPCPSAGQGQLLIRTSVSLVSAGTERMLVEFGRANLIEKARSQPEKVRQVIDKARTDGILPTLEAVQRKLDDSIALGYCNVGVVLEVGREVTGFSVGDRVVSNGNHAEVVAVPANLCARIPDQVDEETAVFAVLGAVALHSIRLLQPTLGESIAVSGLGLVGLLAVQLLQAHGCRVLGLDYAPHRLELARRFGAETVDLNGSEPLVAAQHFSRGRGMDAVLVAASTKSNEPIHQAARMCRKRGRIVLVGVVGLEMMRTDFYEKELTFQVSCSYGPGRYDRNYEEKGKDYPPSYVRWTAQRNFEAVLDMMAGGRLATNPLVSHRFPIDQVAQAYEVVAGAALSLGIVLQYPAEPAAESIAVRRRTIPLRQTVSAKGSSPSVAFIGAGNHAASVLMPAFSAAGARLRSVVSISGVSALRVGRKFRFEMVTTDPEQVFADPEVDGVVIATPHDSHADLVLRAMAAGKKVFVEKPLCLTLAELAAIEASYQTRAQEGSVPILMVGFNRRFAPQVQKLRELLSGASIPKALVLTINAGAIPANHWIQDQAVGGGRLVGEACHFVDLLRYLVQSPIVDQHGTFLDSSTADTASLQFAFGDGSIGTVHYFANGNRRLSKERLEIFCSGRVLQLDNFRKLRGIGWPGSAKMNLWRQDKGHLACVRAFLAAIALGQSSPIPFDEITEVTRASLALAESGRRR